MIDYLALGKALGYLGKDIGPGIIEHARQMELKLPPQLDDPSANSHPSSSSKSSGTSPSTTSPSWHQAAQALATEPMT